MEVVNVVEASNLVDSHFVVDRSVVATVCGVYLLVDGIAKEGERGGDQGAVVGKLGFDLLQSVVEAFGRGVIVIAGAVELERPQGDASLGSGLIELVDNLLDSIDIGLRAADENGKALGETEDFDAVGLISAAGDSRGFEMRSMVACSG